jgi:hypothetical protein
MDSIDSRSMVSMVPAGNTKAAALVGAGWRTAPWTVLGSVGAWILFLSAGVGPIVGDTINYLNVSRSWAAGAAITDGFHGYAAGVLFVPAILLDSLAPLSLEQAVLIQSSLVMAIGAWLVIPWFVSTVTGREVRLIDRLAVTGLLFVLYGAYASYALTDIPAMLLFLGAVGLWRSQPLAAGAMIALAYNLRPAYIVALLGLIALIAIRRTRMGWLIVGIALALAPQVVLNIKVGEAPFPAPAESATTGSQILAASLLYQRTATSIDPAWPSAGIVSCEPAGLAVGDTLSMAAYVSILASHPAASTAMLSRHIVNGLWLDERGPVVASIADRTMFYGIVSMILVGVLLSLACAGTGRLALGLVALACMPAVAAVIEPRHFLPMGVLAVAMLLPALRWLSSASARVRGTTIAACLALVVVSASVAAATRASEVTGEWMNTAGQPVRLAC